MVLILEQIFSKEVHIQISLLVSPKVRHLWRTLETDMLEQALQNNLLDPSNFAKLDASLLVTRCSKAFLPNGGRELYLASALRKLCVLDSDPCIPTTSCLQTWQAWPGFENFVSISIPYQSSTWKGRNWAWLCNDGKKQTCSTGVGMHQMICQRRVSPAVGSKWKCRKNVLPYKLHLKVHLLRFRMFIWAEVFRKASKWHPLCRHTSFAWHHSCGTRSAWHPQTDTLMHASPGMRIFCKGSKDKQGHMVENILLFTNLELPHILWLFSIAKVRFCKVWRGI